MNLSLPFIGSSSGLNGGGLMMSAEIFNTPDIGDTNLNLEVGNQITATDLIVTVPVLHDIVVEADLPEEIVYALDMSIPAEILSIDNEFNIGINMEEGKGFPLYVGELTTHSDTVASLDMSADITEEATAYITGDVHPANDIEVSINAENSIAVDSRTLAVSNDLRVTDLQVSLEAEVGCSDGEQILLSVDRNEASDLNLMVESTVTAVDVLIECTTVPEDQIVYQVADIDRGMRNGTAVIHPNEWSAIVINVPVLEDGTRTTVSNFLMEKLSDKYGEAVHENISLIIARDTVSGDEMNYVVSNGYVTPDGSTNDFKLCSLSDDKFTPVPFLVKSVSNETLTIDWEI